MLAVLSWAGTTQGSGAGSAIPADPSATSGVVTSDIVLTGGGYVATGNAITVTLLGLQHDFAGDLHITLSYIVGGKAIQTVDVLNRIGATTANPYGTSADFGNDQGGGDNYQFNTDYAGNIWAVAACSDSPACTEPYGDADSLPGVSTDKINKGQYFTSTTGGARTNLSYAFSGMSVSGGTWRLTVTDAADPNVGSFIGWQISITTVASPPAAAVTAVAGTPQSAFAGTSFATALQAKVTDAASNPVNGVAVTFTAPSSGASATFSGNSAVTTVTNAAGIATSALPIANNTVGAYTVIASVPGYAPASFSLTNSASGLSSSAKYGGLDTTTQGTWTGKYGVDGYLVPTVITKSPTYATVSFIGGSLYKWIYPTTDVRALQTAPKASARVASAFTSGTNFTINVNLTDGNPHRIALYLLDWDSTSRTETISIKDASSNAVLDTEAFSGFHNGEYAVWNVQGHVLIQIAKTGGASAVCAGVFFDPVSSSLASATYSGLDTTTLGTWTGKYGASGEIIPNDVTNAPLFATVSLTGESLYTWAYSTTDLRDLQTSSGASNRIASIYYSASSFTINLNLTDGNTHKISLYLLDWDTSARTQTISILDAGTNAVLDTEQFSGFHNGEYAAWAIKGHVVIQVTCTGGYNAVVNGIFFD